MLPNIFSGIAPNLVSWCRMGKDSLLMTTIFLRNPCCTFYAYEEAGDCQIIDGNVCQLHRHLDIPMFAAISLRFIQGLL